MTHDMIKNPNFLNPGLYNTPITRTIQIANLKKDINTINETGSNCAIFIICKFFK